MLAFSGSGQTDSAFRRDQLIYLILLLNPKASSRIDDQRNMGRNT